MAKIVYGIQSDGMGHYTRSKVVLEYLKKQGHDIKVLSSERAYELLVEEGYDTYKVDRTVFFYKNNKVQYPKTISTYAFKSTTGMFYRNGYVPAEKLILDFKPDIIISDFEFFCGKVANRHGIPLMCVDNIQTVSHTLVFRDIPKKYHKYIYKQLQGIDLLFRKADKFLILSFFDPKPAESLKDKVVIIKSLVRNEIFKAKGTPTENHILVYQTSDTNRALLPALKANPDYKFIVYGLNREEEIDNIQLKMNSMDGFVKDLASCKALITNGGYTLISEAVILGKPILANPIQDQFEQIVNAVSVENCGYGMNVDDITGEAVAEFLGNLDSYSEKLKEYKQDDNSESLEIIGREVEKLTKDFTFPENVKVPKNIFARILRAIGFSVKLNWPVFFPRDKHWSKEEQKL